MIRRLLVPAVFLMAGLSAQAADFGISVNIGSRGYYGRPVIVAPPPVYIAPRPVYVAPRAVYVAPRPIYVVPGGGYYRDVVVHPKQFRKYHRGHGYCNRWR